MRTRGIRSVFRTMVGHSGKITVKLLVVLAIAGLAVAFFYRPAQAWMLSRRFPESLLYDYERGLDHRQSPAVRSGEELYRTGKVVLVVPSRWKIYRQGNAYATRMTPEQAEKKVKLADGPRLDHHFFTIDPAVRASAPGEVGTVIFCEYGKRREGTYVSAEGTGPTAPAYRRLVNLHFYDLKSGEYIGAHRILGEEPADRTTIMGSFSGTIPDLRTFVDGLEVRHARN